MSLPNSVAAILDARPELFVRRAGIGRALERHHHPRMQVRKQRFHGVEDEAQIGLAIFVQRGRDAENKCIHFPAREKSVVGSKPRSVAPLIAFGRNMLDVGNPRAKRVDLGSVDIEANDLVANLAIPKHQWQANVAEAHDADLGCLPVQLIDQLSIHVRTPMVWQDDPLQGEPHKVLTWDDREKPRNRPHCTRRRTIRLRYYRPNDDCASTTATTARAETRGRLGGTEQIDDFEGGAPVTVLGNFSSADIVGAAPQSVPAV